MAFAKEGPTFVEHDTSSKDEANKLVKFTTDNGSTVILMQGDLSNEADVK